MNAGFRETKVRPEEFTADQPASATGPFYQGLLNSADFMALRRPPSYLLDGVAQRGMVYSLTAPTGHGKTAIALLLGLCVAAGCQFCGREVRRGSVLFLAGENPDNVMMQWFALCADQGVDHASLPVHWHNGPFGIGSAGDRLADDAARIPDLRLVIADTLQAFFQGDDDNDNGQMLNVAREFRTLTKLPSRPTCLIPAHPVKNARRDNLLPRGGSAFLNEMDGNLTAWTEEGIASLHWQGKHRGANFEPLNFEMARIEPPGLVDEDGRQMPCTVARPIMHQRAEQIAKEAVSRENQALAAIRANSRISEQGLADTIGGTKSAAHRLIQKLLQLKWIKKHARDLILTPAGKAVLDG